MLWEDELPRRRFIRRTKVFLGFRLGNYGFWWREGVVLSLAKWEEALRHQKGKLNRGCVSAREQQGAGDAWLSAALFSFHVTRPSASLAASGRGNTRKSRGGRVGSKRRPGGVGVEQEKQQKEELGLRPQSRWSPLPSPSPVGLPWLLPEWDRSPRVWVCCRHRLRSSGGLTIGQKKIQVSPISIHFYWRGILYCLYYWVEQEYHFNMRVFPNSLCFTSQVFTAVLFYVPLAEHRGGEIRSWPPVAFLFPPEEVSWSSMAHVT